MIFIVIGLTGSGKTNFINALTRTLSHDSGADTLSSKTQTVHQRTVEHHDGRQLIFLDTPGFDNTVDNLTDVGILMRLAVHLRTSFRSTANLGIIYFHRITDNRMNRSPLDYIDLLHNTCDSVSVRQICLVTTMWDDVDDRDQAKAEMRETFLREEFQKKKVPAVFRRFDNRESSDSAWGITNAFVDDKTHSLEDVFEERRLNEPRAREEASYIKFRQLLAQRKEVVQQLVDQATHENPTRVQELRAEHETLDAQLRVTFLEMQERKISIIKRALQWLRRGTVAKDDGRKVESNDTIIAVVGPTGSGKTKFINTLIGKAEERGASDLKPDTKSVTPYIIPYTGPTQLPGRLILVDTPGLDEALQPDPMMLRDIFDRLNAKDLNGATLKPCGVIYLHRITDNRMPGSIFNYPQLFRRVCGDIPWSKVCFVTTMWDLAMNTRAAERRETQLKSDVWRKMIHEGAVAKRFDNTKKCAWEIVEDLICLGQQGEGDQVSSHGPGGGGERVVRRAPSYFCLDKGRKNRFRGVAETQSTHSS